MLQERVQVIKKSDEDETAIAIANSLAVGKNFKYNQEAVLERWHGGENGDRKLSKIPKSVYLVISLGVV